LPRCSSAIFDLARALPQREALSRSYLQRENPSAPSKMAGAPTATYRVDPDGVAVITLSNPPVNALHPDGGEGNPG
jgi:hypothetical protein